MNNHTFYALPLIILCSIFTVQIGSAQTTLDQPALDKVLTKTTQQSLSPQMVLDRLKEGNDRFVNNDMVERDLKEQVKATSESQYPGAVVLACIDSRVPVESIFDQGIGDIFVARVAGNTVNEEILGSIEYGTAVAGSKLVVIMGHEACGAVKSSIANAELSSNVDMLLARIKPAIQSMDEYEGAKAASNTDFLDKVVHKNVHLTKKEMLTKSPVLKAMMDEGEIMIVGAYYNLETGKVTFLD